MAKGNNKQNAASEVTEADAAPATPFDADAAGTKLGFVDDGEYVQGSVGFPPFWKPSEEKAAAGDVQGVHGTVTGFEVSPDSEDPEETFERVILVALSPIMCATGSVAKGTYKEVLVQPGEEFSMSNYVQLNLRRYMGGNIKAFAIKKIQHTPKKKLWVWDLQISAATHTERLEAIRSGTIKALPARA